MPYCLFITVSSADLRSAAVRGRVIVAIQGDALKKGWGVVRLKPWHLAGIFVSSADAENLAQQMGEGYVVKYGDHAFGSPDFKFSDTEQS
jgi:hypothetical protein